jgi:hypothetical protein
MQFLNFKEISEKIPFKSVLDWLNIPYTTTYKYLEIDGKESKIQVENELKGDTFIVLIERNLYFNPSNKNDKGGIINFIANRKNIDLREAAQELKDTFLKEQKPSDRELPNLELHYHPILKDKGISEEMAKDYEIGFVKQHSIISGRIAFKIYDELSIHTGYVAFNPKDNSWFFPKGFKRELYNIHRIDSKEVILTVSIWETLEYIKKGMPAVSLIGKTMTDKQAEQLSRFTNILVVHPEPDNIILRLHKNSFVKSVHPDSPTPYL